MLLQIAIRVKYTYSSNSSRHMSTYSTIHTWCSITAIAMTIMGQFHDILYKQFVQY